MAKKLVAVLLSVALLSMGWLGLTGLFLPIAFVPLLWISAEAEATRRGWWQTFRWAMLTFVLWNAATVWWIWNATPVGPVAATLFSTFWNMVAFMTYHTVSKRASQALASVLFVTAWIATEYLYTNSEFSWPWLTLGNGFSHDVWAVQWYEWTGVFGGSLWVLVANLMIFRALRRRTPRRTAAAVATVVVPIIVSLALWFGYRPADEGSVRIAAIQPNVDCYLKFHGDDKAQEENIFQLLDEVPADAEFVLLPETAFPGYYWEPVLSSYLYPPETGRAWVRLIDWLKRTHPESMVVTGANTRQFYAAGVPRPYTARPYGRTGDYQDIFNTAVGIHLDGLPQLHHKGKLVVGVEKTPSWIFSVLRFLVIDLGGTLGQIGEGKSGTSFDNNGTKIGPAICYEGIYGEFFGDHVRKGAQVMAILSNDGWWGDTPGYRHLFSISRLRAIEHRRAVVRSANTGQSGFISPRGEVSSTLGWEERGVLTEEVPLNSELTLYTRYGDYVGRIALYVTLLCLLYYVAYRTKRRNHLVD